MRVLLQTISALALVSTLLPAVLYLDGSLPLPQTKWGMLVSTVVWFVATPLWMGRQANQKNP